ncbi:hypothetical protein E0Z10_g10911 [Xylaria hypoxylon]|uniref:Uncharacterized protein n=1 Tax=Xylaria hypoxylon TaxID=37992 RepID=A0A4Z0Y9B3_9PEZI|nr:hypothetical protein E0Z10_g10911 [Xylaria hypoxylon]
MSNPWSLAGMIDEKRLKDDEIRKLKEQVAQTDKRAQKPEAENHRRLYDSRGGDDDDAEALGRSLERSESLVRREYNSGAGRLGKPFAMGDLITENQLQAQIITLVE